MGLRELATIEKLGGESDGELTQLLKLISCRNITEEQWSIIHIIWRVCKMPSKLVYTIVRRQTKDLTTADVQRVDHHDAVLIKENESDQRESNGNPIDQRNFTVQRNLS